MSEEKKNDEQVKDKGSEQEQEQEQQSKIELDADTYQALLDRLDEYEEKLNTKSKDPVDQLADEAKSGKQEKQEPVDLDSLSQSQLAKFMMNQTQQILQPIAVQIESILLNQEIAELGEDEQKVFDSNQDEVFQILSENPKLSVKKAVKLAVKETKDKPGDEKGDPKKRLLRHLPQANIHSERPGRTASAMESEVPKSRTGAAAKAIEDLDVQFNY